ncbi:shikimate kinase [Acetitomaculum ruminis DSM 5522]|uniref:Shikimate kinase n=1 Tax=Acetitomaculum ruminis DSM 5522 TaxID=1120918 RepID=A0A1I1A894_9FIRM|nr:shikimate kinase [Acetitomaculum ruminis]SFB32623.1 shikimate kinase [Acetitomaculum ruminis DSM 5522]
MNNLNIFLIGFMGSGKSTIAKKIYKKYGYKLVEMDELIEKNENMTINEMFEKYGEEHFRNIESNTLIEMSKENNLVVSCGGGVVLRKENAEYMKKNGVVVWLNASAKSIYDRIKNTDNRPLLKGNMNEEYIKELMDKRYEKYKACADIVIDTDRKKLMEIADEVIEKVKARKK